MLTYHNLLASLLQNFPVTVISIVPWPGGIKAWRGAASGFKSPIDNFSLRWQQESSQLRWVVKTWNNHRIEICRATTRWAIHLQIQIVMVAAVAKVVAGADSPVRCVASWTSRLWLVCWSTLWLGYGFSWPLATFLLLQSLVRRWEVIRGLTGDHLRGVAALGPFCPPRFFSPWITSNIMIWCQSSRLSTHPESFCSAECPWIKYQSRKLVPVRPDYQWSRKDRGARQRRDIFLISGEDDRGARSAACGRSFTWQQLFS